MSNKHANVIRVLFLFNFITISIEYSDVIATDWLVTGDNYGLSHHANIQMPYIPNV